MSTPDSRTLVHTQDQDFGNVFVSAGDYIKIANGGESTGAAVGYVVIDIAR